MYVGVCVCVHNACMHRCEHAFVDVFFPTSVSLCVCACLW